MALAPTSLISEAAPVALPEPAAPVGSLANKLYPEGGATPTVPVEPEPEAAAPVEPKVESASEVKAEPTPVEPTEEKPPAPALTLESYAELKVPETITVNDEVLGDFKKTALEAGVPPGEAQKFIDLYTKVATQQAEAFLAVQQNQFLETNNKWLSEVNAMPEFQGEAKKRNLDIIGTFMEDFGSNDLKQILNNTGAGNHPEMVKFILKIAQAMTEDSPPTPGNPPRQTGRRSLGETLYPEQPKQ